MTNIIHMLKYNLDGISELASVTIMCRTHWMGIKRIEIGTQFRIRYFDNNE